MRFLAPIVAAALASMVLVGCGEASTASVTAATANTPNPANRVVVYYMHRTFRCFSCLWIENTMRQTLKESFPSELASGRLELRVEDYWKRKDLARQYDVNTVSIVVVNVADGQEVSHRTLDKVWDLKLKNEEFRAYITEAVRAALNKAK